MRRVIIITNEADTTAHAVIGRLDRLGASYDLVDPARSVAGGVTWTIPNMDTETSVWYRRPSQPESAPSGDEGIDRFSLLEVKRAVEAQHCGVPRESWWNHPASIEFAASKPTQLTLARSIGLDVPDSCITNDEGRAREFVRSVGGSAIVKPLASINATVGGEKRVMFTTRVSEGDIAPSAFVGVPHFFQRYIEKECELRVTLVGNDCYTARIDSQQVDAAKVDWRRDAYYRSPMVPEVLPSGLVAKLQRLRKGLGLNWGAVDLIRTPDGQYVFLEINMNGQWLWVEESTGMPISEAFAENLVRG